MYAAPRTREGRWALGLLLAVALYPFYWSVTLLVPESWEAARTGVVVVLGVVLVAGFVLAGVALLARRDRSSLLVALTGLTALLVLFFAVGELLSAVGVLPH